MLEQHRFKRSYRRCSRWHATKLVDEIHPPATRAPTFPHPMYHKYHCSVPLQHSHNTGDVLSSRQASASAPSIPRSHFSSLARLDQDRLSAMLAEALSPNASPLSFPERPTVAPAAPVSQAWLVSSSLDEEIEPFHLSLMLPCISPGVSSVPQSGFGRTFWPRLKVVSRSIVIRDRAGRIQHTRLTCVVLCCRSCLAGVLSNFINHHKQVVVVMLCLYSKGVTNSRFFLVIGVEGNTKNHVWKCSGLLHGAAVLRSKLIQPIG